jgi:hypothetical protein
MEISSPPYPRQSVNPRELCQSIGELYHWVEEQRQWAEDVAIRLQAPQLPYLPPKVPMAITKDYDRFAMLAVTDMHTSWTILRHIREHYDEILRNYESEDDWNSDTCSFQRLAVIKAGAFLLAVAYLPHEHREAKQQDFMMQTEKTIAETLEKLMQKLQKRKSSETMDFDQFFHGDDN